MQTLNPFLWLSDKLAVGKIAAIIVGVEDDICQIDVATSKMFVCREENLFKKLEL